MPARRCLSPSDSEGNPRSGLTGADGAAIPATERAARVQPASLMREAVAGGGGRGVSNTPFPPKICNEGRAPSTRSQASAWIGCGSFSRSLVSRRSCARRNDHDYRPRGMPSTRMVARGLDGDKRTFQHFLGDDEPRLLYHRDSATLHVDVHFESLVSVSTAVERGQAVVARLGRLGIESLFPVRVRGPTSPVTSCSFRPRTFGTSFRRSGPCCASVVGSLSRSSRRRCM